MDSGHGMVRLVRQADLGSVSRVLAAAFQDDPLLAWFFPDAATRPVLSGVWMRNTAELSMRAGHAFVNVDLDGSPAAAALWCPPDVKILDADSFRTSWALLVGANPHRVDEVRQGLHLLAGAHPESGHFYLNTIGVEPDRRGRGLGRPLVERVLTVADAEGVPCYLESSNPRNIGFYQRYGFDVLQEIELPGGPIIRPMWRNAA